MGTPTDCVYLGVNALMRPRPDIVVSGINAGPNLGDDVIYSGTVAAAMEGRHLGFPALAVSLDGHKHYDTAAAVTCSILRALCKEPLRTGRILNINVPDLPLDQIKGIRVTRCGTRHPADQVIPQQDPRGNTLYWIGPPGGKCDAGPGTDFAAVDEGYVSITPLHVDLTAHSAQDVVSDWLNSVGVGTPMVSRRVQALLDQLRAQGIQDELVLNALAAVPREKFVDEAFEQKAWDNIALPIGQGQTISQPYMVARMTELLELTPQSRVLEMALVRDIKLQSWRILSQHVCSVERIKGLQWQARRRLKNLDLHNVSTRHGDGWQGWQARAPFDAIIVTAAPPEIPTALMTQLDEGGILVLPVGEEHQYLKRVRRRGGEFIIDTVEAVRFCPFSEG
ncbi:stationary phase survival protein SurE [Escherichia coli]|uniref:Protein-L-isoaspartate O-methyltransferase n=9 Tax=Gammaproteobacteria TaxID=1236 RepID=A0A376WB07_ECOLX|nr:stationary phase survival protein SurE [Escherichia coli]